MSSGKGVCDALRKTIPILGAVAALASTCCAKELDGASNYITRKVPVKLRLLKHLDTESDLTGFAWSPDGKYIAISQDFGKQISIREADGLGVVSEFRKTHGTGAGRILFTSDSKYFITSGDNSPHGQTALVIVSVSTAKTAARLNGPNDAAASGAVNLPSSFVLSRMGRTLFVAFRFPHVNPAICSYDTRNWILRSCWPSNRGVTAMVSGKQEDALVTADSTGKVQFWNTESHKIVHEFKASSVALRALALDPSGHIVATGEGNRGIAWDEVSGKLIQQGERDSIRLWNADTGTKLESFRATSDVAEISFSKTGQHFVAQSSLDIRKSEYSIFDTQKNQKPSTVSPLDGTSLGAWFSADGTKLAVAGKNSIQIYSFDETGSR